MERKGIATQGGIAERSEARFHRVRYERRRSVKISSHCRLLSYKELKGNNYQEVLLWKEQERAGENDVKVLPSIPPPRNI